MESVREVIDRGRLRELLRMSCELSELRERLETLMSLGVCPHCGAKVFKPEDIDHAKKRK